MNDAPNPVVFAVQSAVLELLELVEYISQNDIPETKEELQQEVQKNVLMFIAAIVLTNKQYFREQLAMRYDLADVED